MTDSQPVPEQQLRNLEIVNFTEFPKKFKLPDKKGFELMEQSRADSRPPASPRSQAERAAHGTEYSHRPAWLSAWLCTLPAPAHLLTS